jgi:hypothetical protein
MRSRVPVAALLFLLCACGPKSGNQAPPVIDPTLACENVVTTAHGLPSDWVLDLGTLAVGTQNVQFTIPAGTSSFVIITQEVGQTAPGTVHVNGVGAIPNAVVPTDLYGPDGLYYDDFVNPPTTSMGGFTYYDATRWLAIDQGYQPAVGVLPFPTTSGGLAKLQSVGQVQPGIWSFTLNDWAYDCPFSGCTGTPHGGKYRVQVVMRPSPVSGGPIPTTGTLDVDVYLATDPVSSLVPNAAGAPSSPLVKRWREVLRRLLANGGITLGVVTYHDLPPSVLAKYAPNGAVDVNSLDPCGKLCQLFASSFAPSRGVHVFLADTLVDRSSGSSYQVAGVDGSIPGPSGYPGTISSGAVVGLEDLGYKDHAACNEFDPTNLSSCGVDDVAYVTAHEIGHWLGLFHPTEQMGTFFDPLGDTPPCPCHLCAPTAADKLGCYEVTNNPTTTMDTRWCVAGPTCGGGDNLMFWLFDPPTSTGTLTVQQGQVARLNPAVQ